MGTKIKIKDDLYITSHLYKVILKKNKDIIYVRVEFFTERLDDDWTKPSVELINMFALKELRNILNEDIKEWLVVKIDEILIGGHHVHWKNIFGNDFFEDDIEIENILEPKGYQNRMYGLSKI